MEHLTWWLLLGLCGYFSVPLLSPIFQSQMVTNYQGKSLPTGLGLAFIIPPVLLMVGHFRVSNEAPYFAVLILFFALLGSIDDSYGNSTKKGVRGHFTSRGISTGVLKALGGLGISLIVGAHYASSLFELLLHGLVIALSANVINLLDLRPGRAGKAFLFFAIPLIVLTPGSLLPLQWMMASLLGYLPWDLRGFCIMGDSGSNPLGATLGFAVVLGSPLAVKLIVVIFLLGANLLAEKYSFSKFIESNRVLHFLDRLGR